MKVLTILLLLFTFSASAQDTTKVGDHYVTLSEVVVHSKLDVPSFIQRVKSDTSFYKAFKNLRVIGFDAINDIRMLDKKGRSKAYMFSKTRQMRADNCRTMEVLEEKVEGDMYDNKGHYNYYTMSMYASLFFTDGKVCGETNIVGDKDFSVSDKSGLEKHKEQLKILFFQPGRKIKGLPFMSNKTNMFSSKLADDYDMNIDLVDYLNTDCYVFHQKVKSGRENKVVIQEMTTWFRSNDFEIMGRNYHLKYSTPIYDFDVRMEVEMTTFQGLTVPRLIRYNGDWKAVTKKRERGVFTAVLDNFQLENAY
jgi:hypothetical protein